MWGAGARRCSCQPSKSNFGGLQPSPYRALTTPSCGHGRGRTSTCCGVGPEQPELWSGTGGSFSAKSSSSGMVFVSSTPSSGWRAMKFVQLCSIEHFRKSTIHPWQRPAGKYRSDGRVETGTSAVRHCWVPSRGSAGEIIREPQQRAGRPIWAIAAIPLVQFV